MLQKIRPLFRINAENELKLLKFAVWRIFTFIRHNWQKTSRFRWKEAKNPKISHIHNPISDILLAQLHNCFAKNSSRYYADFTKCKKRIKNLQKSVDKSPRRQYNNTCKQRSYTNTKSSCGSFCFKRDCKSSAVSAKAQRGADRIFSDPFQEKSGTAAVRKLPIERGGYQWISYPR